MRTFLCLSCGEVYSEIVENKEYIMGNSYGALAYLCPKVNCTGNVIEIDDFLISVIKNLNNYGFETLACCSGHSQDSLVQLSNHVNTYILLKQEILGEEIDDFMIEELAHSLPNGFEIETDFYEGFSRFTISKSVDCENEGDCMCAIALNCSDLLKWSGSDLLHLIEKWIHLNKIPDILCLEEEFIGETESEDSDNSASTGF